MGTNPETNAPAGADAAALTPAAPPPSPEPEQPEPAEARLLLVNADVLPEVFARVVDAKRFLAAGKAASAAQAARMAGISRSAFYKYKDAVRPFNDMLHGRIVTFQLLLRDEPGILSGTLNIFAGTGVNILTLNQSIPLNGCAVVTMTAETSELQRPLEEVLGEVSSGAGVIRCEILAG